MGITYQYEPLQHKPKLKNRQYSRFKASFNSTLDLLERELGHLNAKNVVLQADVERSDIRLDGMLRAGAKPRSPAIALSFESKHGPLTYPCDTYTDWQANLRAIGLALEALRSVDRYGVTAKGEQYTGWQALPSPNGDHWTAVDAENWLMAFLGASRSDLETREKVESALRQAEFRSHPDRGGRSEDFKKVQTARKLLLG